MLREQLRSRDAAADGEPDSAADPLSKDPAALRTLSVPALVGVGEHDMPDFFQGGEELARELGADGVAVIPGTGHLAPLEQPAAFCELLLEFMNHGPERPVFEAG